MLPPKKKMIKYTTIFIIDTQIIDLSLMLSQVSSLIPAGEFLFPIDNSRDYFTVIWGLNIDEYRKDYRYITSISRDGKILNQIDLETVYYWLRITLM